MSTYKIDAKTDSITLLAIMCMPHNPELFQIDSIIDFTRQNPEQAQELQADRFLSKLAIEGKLERLKPTRLQKAIDHAQIAGDVLSFLMDIDYGGAEEPSLSKARYLASEWHKEESHDTKYKVGYGRDSIKAHWKKYKRVVHLWAAFRKYQSFNGLYENSTNGPVFWDEFLATTRESDIFLRIAKRFQIYADGFRQRRELNPKPLLPVDAWRIADSIEPIEIMPAHGSDSYQLAPWTKSTLEHYARP